jgi:GTPase SAR1 family protein
VVSRAKAAALTLNAVCCSYGTTQIKNRRICLIGFMAVGKSSIAAQYAQGTYSDAYLPTIENTYDKLVQVPRVSSPKTIAQCTLSQF